MFWLICFFLQAVWLNPFSASLRLKSYGGTCGHPSHEDGPSGQQNLVTNKHNSKKASADGIKSMMRVLGIMCL